MESLEEKIKRVTSEKISLVPYDPAWPELFQQEKDHLLSLFGDFLKRIEHFGSTAVKGLSAKPIIDMLIEVDSLDAAREKMVPVLEKLRYDYFWRPTFGDDEGPFYCWFIKRNSAGERTHHIHVVDTPIFYSRRNETCGFRDYLNRHPQVKKEYETLKLTLAKEYENDRVEYTKQKSEFIAAVMRKIRREL